MKLKSPPPFRFCKFALILLVVLFFFANLTGIFVGHAFAPCLDLSAAKEPRAKEAEVAEASEVVPTSGDKQIDGLIEKASAKYGVDPRFVHAVMWQESRYKATAHSPSGAIGLMQLMPETARRFGCNDCFNPETNIDAGTHYLRWLLERFGGDLSMVLAGYNAGEGSVDRFDGVPPFGETESYVKSIEEHYGKSFHPVLDPAQAVVAFR